MDAVRRTARRAQHQYNKLSRGQLLYAACFLSLAVTLTVLFALYHKALFRALEPLKHDMRRTWWAPIILVLVTAATSFPPLIGYSTSITLAGFVYGFAAGWSVGAAGSIVGAGVTFAVYRYALTSYAKQMTASNPHFRALTEALDGSRGLTLLILIRLCPFPFSLSNAALSTIPSVSYGKFMTATTLALPRIWIHAFVGSRLASFADGDTGSDHGSAVWNWVSIAGGLLLGVATSYLVYKRTMTIARQQRAERGLPDEHISVFEDDEEEDASDRDDLEGARARLLRD